MVHAQRACRWRLRVAQLEERQRRLTLSRKRDRADELLPLELQQFQVEKTSERWSFSASIIGLLVPLQELQPQDYQLLDSVL